MKVDGILEGVILAESSEDHRRLGVCIISDTEAQEITEHERYLKEIELEETHQFSMEQLWFNEEMGGRNTQSEGILPVQT